MKDFIDDFYSYDFTVILHNDESSDDSDSDIEINLESVNVVQDNDDEEEADKMKPISPEVDKEIREDFVERKRKGLSEKRDPISTNDLPDFIIK